MKYRPSISFSHLREDLISGVIVALVSIPISMGYAQIAGLPPVYGLYGSLLPILLFGLISSSPRFVIGVDAMPAVMVGNLLGTLGIAGGSPEALALVPVISLLTGIWFLIFRAFRAGRVVKYISTPVMGGFISGIGATIILMQIPKLFGGSAGLGELIPLLEHLCAEKENFHGLSALLGFGTVAIILVSKKFIPKFPMPVLMMVAGIVLTTVFHVDALGVKLLPAVERGLPRLILPDISLIPVYGKEIVVLALTIALVVMAQTLLATNSYAMKYGEKIDTSRELTAYAAATLSGALVGCCPINGSVSRSGIADQFSVKSQLMSVVASLTMVVVLLFGTDLLKYLPVPVLTGIVIAALIGILDIKMAKKLWKANRRELFIYLMAFFGVLLFGTIYGVVIGVVLSFGAVIVGAVVPPKAFLGVIPGHEDLYDLARNHNARPIRNTVIYRFSGNLFFANIGDFQEDIEAAITPDTKQLIVDGRGISSIDITAAERLVLIYEDLKKRGVRFYLTEHVGAVNDQLRAFGAGVLIQEGAVRRSVELALGSAGLISPYPLEGVNSDGETVWLNSSEHLAEFEWLFGEDSPEVMEKIAREIGERILAERGLTPELLEQAETSTGLGRVGLFDEDELLDHLELYLEDLAQHGDIDEARLPGLERQIEHRRRILEEKLAATNPEALQLLHGHRANLARHFMERNPESYQRILEHHQRIQEKLAKDHPELGERLRRLREDHHSE